MTEAHWIVIFFGVLMCAMSLAASYFEAKEKSKAEPKDAISNSLLTAIPMSHDIATLLKCSCGTVELQLRGGSPPHFARAQHHILQ